MYCKIEMQKKLSEKENNHVRTQLFALKYNVTWLEKEY